MPYANNKGADQPAHPRSLINTFVVCRLDSIISLNFYIRNIKPLASFCGCAGWFESYPVENPEDRSSRDEARFDCTVMFFRMSHFFLATEPRHEKTCHLEVATR